MDFPESIVVYDLKLATDDRKEQKLYASCPGAIYMY